VGCNTSKHVSHTKLLHLKLSAATLRVQTVDSPGLQSISRTCSCREEVRKQSLGKLTLMQLVIYNFIIDSLVNIHRTLVLCLRSLITSVALCSILMLV
jgi:hypothetical protein